ncbi:MAG: hypothetical protein M3R50_03925 [Bacteroidota bacterium]|nr:hypothetical protein [Bacteroidota bacterium]
MKIKHFGIFKNNMNILNWEELRNNEAEKPYYLPYDKEKYLLQVDTNEPSRSTQVILKEIEIAGLNKIYSIGSGIASQEYQLKKFSDHSVVVSDYNSSILRLKKFEIFNDALMLDAFTDPLPVDKNWMVIFPRIDTEFDDNQLSKLFAKCHNSGIKHICFIPAELLSSRIIIAEIKTLLISIIKRKHKVFCGYARSMSSFKKIWSPYYKLSRKYKKDKQIFFLQSK